MRFASKSPKIVVIVPCVAIDAWTERCLRHCLELEYDNFLLALLPDEACKKDISGWTDPKLIVFPTGSLTIAQKRNKGVARFSDAEIYAFIDSDAFPEKDWLKNAVAAFATLPEQVWMVGGPNISPSEQSGASQAVGYAYRSVLLSGPGAYRKSKSPSRYCNDLPACNMLVLSSALREVGGFDEGLITGEDKNLCSQLQKAGGKIFFERTVCVYHQDRDLYAPFFRQRLIWGCSVWGLLARDFSFRKAYLFFPSLLLLFYSVGAVYTFLFPAFRLFYFASIAGFLFICAAEALHHAPLHAFRKTFFALFFGFFVPAFGSLAKLFGLQLDQQKIYQKSRPRDDVVKS